MRKPILVSILLAVCVASYPTTEYGQGHPIPPGVREADKQTNAPVEPPVKFQQKSKDPTVLKQEAEELAKLSAAIPNEMEQVRQGQIPRDLAEQLKRIEKLAKHLRTEIAP